VSEPFDPYRKWLGIPSGPRPPDHYQLLGLRRFESDPDVIDNAAERTMGFVKGHARGEVVELAKRVLQELAAARVTLLDPKLREAYDEELRRRLPAVETQAAGKPGPGLVLQLDADPSQASSLRKGRRIRKSSGGGYVLLAATVLGLFVVGGLGYMLMSSGKLTASPGNPVAVAKLQPKPPGRPADEKLPGPKHSTPKEKDKPALAMRPRRRNPVKRARSLRRRNPSRRLRRRIPRSRSTNTARGSTRFRPPRHRSPKARRGSRQR
jgi:hypothetical protein